MVTYPKVQHKIPELFRLIIELDHIIELKKRLPVIDFAEWKENKETRQRYRWAAEKFIQKQKGGTGGATGG